MKYSEKRMAEICKALGDPTRLKIIKLCSSKGRMLCVGSIAHELGITQPAVSQHLKVLRNAGIMEGQRKGFHVHYYVNPDTLKTYKKEFDNLFKILAKCCPHACKCDFD